MYVLNDKEILVRVEKGIVLINNSFNGNNYSFNKLSSSILKYLSSGFSPEEIVKKLPTFDISPKERLKAIKKFAGELVEENILLESFGSEESKLISNKIAKAKSILGQIDFSDRINASKDFIEKGLKIKLNRSNISSYYQHLSHTKKKTWEV